MKCELCNKETPDRQAIDDGWEPTYLIDGEEVGDPICAECCRDRCQETPDGPELLPVRVLTRHTVERCSECGSSDIIGGGFHSPGSDRVCRDCHAPAVLVAWPGTPRNLANPIDSPYGRYLPPSNLFSRGR